MTFPVFDLFGDPIPARRGRRGRPQHVPTRENVNLVNELRRLNWNQPHIAGALGITPKTLRRWYGHLFRGRKS
jgi:hypothetical protein